MCLSAGQHRLEPQWDAQNTGPETGTPQVALQTIRGSVYAGHSGSSSFLLGWTLEKHNWVLQICGSQVYSNPDCKNQTLEPWDWVCWCLSDKTLQMLDSRQDKQQCRQIHPRLSRWCHGADICVSQRSHRRIQHRAGNLPLRISEQTKPLAWGCPVVTTGGRADRVDM